MSIAALAALECHLVRGKILSDIGSCLQVIYLVRDVWRGLSAKGNGYVLPGGDKGFQRSLKDLTLTRCSPPQNSSGQTNFV